MNTSGGVHGLRLAVLLRAVEDGCNPKWLEEIAQFYEIDLPAGMLQRKPVAGVVVNQGTDRFTPIREIRGSRGPLLSWEDGAHMGSLAPRDSAMIM